MAIADEKAALRAEWYQRIRAALKHESGADQPRTFAIEWPALHNSDPASIWLREIVLEEAKRMRTSRSAQGNASKTPLNTNAEATSLR